MSDFSVFLEPVTGWAYAIFDQMAIYDGRLMFLAGLTSSFIISQAVSWITSSALRLAIIGGVIASAVVGIVATLPQPGASSAGQPPSMQQLARQAPQPPAQSSTQPTQATGAPIRLTPQTQPAQPQLPQAAQPTQQPTQQPTRRN